jgi:LPXTG-site transpeptidase (sortase) family protein
MFIFGHSTGFSVVNNQAYKTFNDLDKLSAGDEIRIESDGKTYIYKVESLVLVDESEAFVDFSKTDRRLTISTCNSFGAKQERWVVEAVFDREV